MILKHGDILSSHPVALLRLLGGRKKERMLKGEKRDEGERTCRGQHLDCVWRPMKAIRPEQAENTWTLGVKGVEVHVSQVLVSWQGSSVAWLTTGYDIIA